MKQQRPYPCFTVTHKAQLACEAGHPWIYDTEVLEAGEHENGGIVDVFSTRGRYIGTGLVSDHSKIRIRLLTRNASDRVDEAFWQRRVRYAWEYRKTVMGDDCNACRVIFGEADQFPGLTVDRFENVLVTQTLSLGIERLKPVIFPLLLQVLREDGQAVDGIFERNDVGIRRLEGLAEGKGWFGEPLPSTRLTLTENGVKYRVDFENGQKTGFFLDQKYNRRATARLAAGRRVLDCFTHTGSFALNAALAGAAHVTAVDISADAVALAQENARLNGLEDRMDFRCENVFDLLPSLKGKPYDFIILDPPAFTKSRSATQNAIRGYKEINLRAMKLLPRGGYLATCSCSHFMTDALFREMLRAAAADAGVCLRQIETRQQAPDHPVLWNVPETDYLKFYLFQIV
ncbi:MAG TPA: class I SAM-dependent rRNA methyltransferase [Firmicutes bacterium]|nr:class I SAM-dependent rRNA methyltransferase [Bacillota bacterium]